MEAPRCVLHIRLLLSGACPVGSALAQPGPPAASTATPRAGSCIRPAHWRPTAPCPLPDPPPLRTTTAQGGFQYWLYNHLFVRMCAGMTARMGHIGSAPIKTFIDQAIQ